MPDDRAPAEHVTAVLDALPLDDRELTSDDAERGRQGREALLADPAAAVPLLLDRLADASFAVKDTVYDLVIAMGGPARPILERERGQRGPVTDVWIPGMLAHLGDERAFDRHVPRGLYRLQDSLFRVFLVPLIHPRHLLSPIVGTLAEWR